MDATATGMTTRDAAFLRALLSHAEEFLQWLDGLLGLPTRPVNLTPQQKELLRLRQECAARVTLVREAVTRGDWEAAIDADMAVTQAALAATVRQEAMLRQAHLNHAKGAQASRLARQQSALRNSRGWGALHVTPAEVVRRLQLHHQDQAHAGESYHRACCLLADQEHVSVSAIKHAAAAALGHTRRMW